MDRRHPLLLNRRELFKLSGGVLLGGAAAALRPSTASAQVQGVCTPFSGYIEVFPTSPFILAPFTEPLPVPAPLAPSDPRTWPIPSDPGQQDSWGATHQVWTSALGLPDPIYYRIKLSVGAHRVTNSLVQPIDRNGLPVLAAHNGLGQQKLPFSTIYGFDGGKGATFPGPMIYARYGQPCIVRFENNLDDRSNPLVDTRTDFGVKEFLTHLHNGHTAPESDGNPNYQPVPYRPGEWVDNLYLNYPAGNDPGEKQSFFWFHDHRMDHTGANVYKGMVGLYPIYDPILDPGDETAGLRLPGVPNPITGRVDYDIPLALYDCLLDDGTTPHKDFHFGCGETHPEWWGQSFFRHFPNHGFVGDVFTVNGVAYPVLHVKRRRYRLRFLDASIARIYELKLMSSCGGPVAAPGKQGQWQLPDGEQCMQFTQIAAEGGLLPFPIVRNSFEIWPAKRREFIVDFKQYLDGSPTTPGDVIYLVNVKQMSNGRKPNDPLDVPEPGEPPFDPNYRVPVLKIVIDDGVAPVDYSVVPKKLRPLTPIDPNVLRNAPQREFELQRGGPFGGEIEWLINGEEFHPENPMAFPQKDVPEVWTIRNGGGGWVHPMHLHMEEHRVISRNGVAVPFDAGHPDDESREDVVALKPGEEVVLFRNFRTFSGKYVAHCHNLAHEDHAMMFGWEILP